MQIIKSELNLLIIFGSNFLEGKIKREVRDLKKLGINAVRGLKPLKEALNERKKNQPNFGGNNYTPDDISILSL
jgi:LPS O-antigen subunit length determinant protein (WzzB/FepE family)